MPQRRQQQQNLAENPESNLPRLTPTGVPKAGTLVLPTETVLKSLQIKADLTSLGVAPRCYIEKLKESVAHQQQQPSASEGGEGGEGNDMQMHVDEVLGNSERMALTDRFEKIQGVRPTLPAADGPKGAGGRGGKTLRIVPRVRQNARSRRYNR